MFLGSLVCQYRITSESYYTKIECQNFSFELSNNSHKNNYVPSHGSGDWASGARPKRLRPRLKTTCSKRIFHQFLFCWKTFNVQGMRRKTDILQEPTDILASKLINIIIETTEKVSFDAKISVGSCKISVLRPMPWTFNVFRWNKKWRKNPLCSYEKPI